MQKPLTVLLVTSLLLSACGGWSTSSVNPRNWFGSSKSVPVDINEGSTNPLLPPDRINLLTRPEAPDASLPIAKVTELRIEATPSGAIIYAVGVATRQGAFESSLRPVLSDDNKQKGILEFSFRVVYPVDATLTGSDFSRTVHEAYSISKQDLQGVRLIRVVGRENALESRRR